VSKAPPNLLRMAYHSTGEAGGVGTQLNPRAATPRGSAAPNHMSAYVASADDNNVKLLWRRPRFPGFSIGPG
jgi:hypothetical protein